MANSRAFRLQLRSMFETECEARILVAVQKIGMDLLRKVILKTPVASGRLRGNWLVTIGTPAAGTVDRLDPTGAVTIREGSAVIAGLSEPQAIYLTNNLPYATALENGHSQQAPAGMVAVTLAELEAFAGRDFA